MPEPAPEVIMDANGAYWRRYPDSLSMCPTSTDNDPLAEPVVVYRREDGFRAENDRLREALRRLAQHHHDTITGSRLHDPENIKSFEDCSCKSCRAVVAALEGQR